MADEFQAGGTCSGSWWSTARTGGFEGMALAASVSCSTSISDISGGGGGFSWAASDLVEGKAVASDEAVGSSIAFQGIQKSPQVCDQMPTTGSMLDSTLQMAGFDLSSPTIDWNQTLLRSSGRSEPSFHAMLQESNRGQTSTEDISSNPFKDMNHGFMVDQQHLSSSNEPGFPLVPASYGCPSALLQGLLEADNKPQQPLYHDNRGVNYHQPPIANYHVASTQPLWARFPQHLKGSPAKQPTSNQLQFSNNTPFWNASAGAASEPRSSFYSPVPAQFGSQPFAQKTSLNCITSRSNPEGAGESSSVAKKGEPAFKKPRIETPSPLPTFKVRKEKLGDRITALQQLVSPFGKTDTASVLHEAIEYIKFLHDQVGVLSTPYLKNGHPMQHQQNSDKSKDGEGPKQDLRSRGLCLVPIASTYPVASETTPDFWTPTFGGTYR